MQIVRRFAICIMHDCIRKYKVCIIVYGNVKYLKDENNFDDFLEKMFFSNKSEERSGIQQDP